MTPKEQYHAVQRFADEAITHAATAQELRRLERISIEAFGEYSEEHLSVITKRISAENTRADEDNAVVSAHAACGLAIELAAGTAQHAGDDSEEHADALTVVSDQHLALGLHREASAALEARAAIVAKRFGAGSAEAFEAASRLAEVHLMMDDCDKAIEILAAPAHAVAASSGEGSAEHFRATMYWREALTRVGLHDEAIALARGIVDRESAGSAATEGQSKGVIGDARRRRAALQQLAGALEEASGAMEEEDEDDEDDEDSDWVDRPDGTDEDDDSDDEEWKEGADQNDDDEDGSTHGCSADSGGGGGEESPVDSSGDTGHGAVDMGGAATDADHAGSVVAAGPAIGAASGAGADPDPARDAQPSAVPKSGSSVASLGNVDSDDDGGSILESLHDTRMDEPVRQAMLAEALVIRAGIVEEIEGLLVEKAAPGIVEEIEGLLVEKAASAPSTTAPISDVSAASSSSGTEAATDKPSLAEEQIEALGALACCIEAAQDPAMALPIHEKRVGLALGSLGLDSEEFEEALEGHGNCLVLAGRPDDAVAVHLRHMDAIADCKGPKSDELLAALTWLADYASKLEDISPETVKSLTIRLLKLSATVKGVASEEHESALQALLKLLVSAGNHRSATTLQEQHLAAVAKAEGKETDAYRTGRLQLARFLRAAGRPEEAQTIARDEIKLVGRTYGIGSQIHLETIKMAASKYKRKSRSLWDRWEPPLERLCISLLDEAVANATERCGMDSEEALQCIVRRSEILEDLAFDDKKPEWSMAAVQTALRLHGSSSFQHARALCAHVRSLVDKHDAASAIQILENHLDIYRDGGAGCDLLVREARGAHWQTCKRWRTRSRRDDGSAYLPLIQRLESVILGGIKALHGTQAGEDAALKYWALWWDFWSEHRGMFMPEKLFSCFAAAVASYSGEDSGSFLMLLQGQAKKCLEVATTVHHPEPWRLSDRWADGSLDLSRDTPEGIACRAWLDAVRAALPIEEVIDCLMRLVERERHRLPEKDATQLLGNILKLPHARPHEASLKLSFLRRYMNLELGVEDLHGAGGEDRVVADLHMALPAVGALIEQLIGRNSSEHAHHLQQAALGGGLWEWCDSKRYEYETAPVTARYLRRLVAVYGGASDACRDAVLHVVQDNQLTAGFCLLGQRVGEPSGTTDALKLLQAIVNIWLDAVREKYGTHSAEYGRALVEELAPSFDDPDDFDPFPWLHSLVQEHVDAAEGVHSRGSPEHAGALDALVNFCLPGVSDSRSGGALQVGLAGFEELTERAFEARTAVARELMDSGRPGGALMWLNSAIDHCVFRCEQQDASMSVLQDGIKMLSDAADRTHPGFRRECMKCFWTMTNVNSSEWPEELSHQCCKLACMVLESVDVAYGRGSCQAIRFREMLMSTLVSAYRQADTIRDAVAQVLVRTVISPELAGVSRGSEGDVGLGLLLYQYIQESGPEGKDSLVADRWSNSTGGPASAASAGKGTAAASTVGMFRKVVEQLQYEAEAEDDEPEDRVLYTVLADLADAVVEREDSPSPETIMLLQRISQVPAEIEEHNLDCFLTPLLDCIAEQCVAVYGRRSKEHLSALWDVLEDKAGQSVVNFYEWDSDVEKIQQLREVGKTYRALRQTMLQEGLIHPDELPPRPYGHFKVGMGGGDTAGDVGGDGGSAKSQAASGAGRDECRDAGARQTAADAEHHYTPHRIRMKQLIDPAHAQSTVCAPVGEEDLLPGECPALFMCEGDLFDRKWWQEDDGAWLPQAVRDRVECAVGAKGSTVDDSVLHSGVRSGSGAAADEEACASVEGVGAASGKDRQVVHDGCP